MLINNKYVYEVKWDLNYILSIGVKFIKFIFLL